MEILKAEPITVAEVVGLSKTLSFLVYQKRAEYRRRKQVVGKMHEVNGVWKVLQFEFKAPTFEAGGVHSTGPTIDGAEYVTPKNRAGFKAKVKGTVPITEQPELDGPPPIYKTTFKVVEGHWETEITFKF